MKLYEIVIQPISAIGTPFKGDTIFGHFCWQVHYQPELVEGGLEFLIRLYGERPAVVFSSAFPMLEDDRYRYALKRPDLPLSTLFPEIPGNRIRTIKERKEHKKKKWMLVEKNLTILPGFAEFVDSRQLAQRILDHESEDPIGTRLHSRSPRFEREYAQPHNTINRITGTTGTGEFAPYSMDCIFYPPGTRLTIFVLVDESVTDIASVRKALSLIGASGFGRDASIGLGRFEVIGDSELQFPDATGANALYCLSPCVPQPGSYRDAYFAPFVRFGKHGDQLGVRRIPFKNPVLTADEGALFIPTEATSLEKQYFGSAVGQLSKAEPNTVAQGYSICLPLSVEL